MSLPELELDSDFNDDIDRRPEPARRGKPPLTHRVDSALVETCAKALEHLDGTDAAVASDDEQAELLAARPARATRGFHRQRVDRLHFRPGQTGNRRLRLSGRMRRCRSFELLG